MPPTQKNKTPLPKKTNKGRAKAASNNTASSATDNVADGMANLKKGLVNDLEGFQKEIGKFEEQISFLQDKMKGMDTSNSGLFSRLANQISDVADKIQGLVAREEHLKHTVSQAVSKLEGPALMEEFRRIAKEVVREEKCSYGSEAEALKARGGLKDVDELMKAWQYKYLVEK